MEGIPQILLQVFLVVFVLTHSSFSEDRPKDFSSCPEEEIRKCLEQGRHACVGREQSCGSCIHPYFTEVAQECKALKSEDLPEEAIDDLLEKLNERKNKLQEKPGSEKNTVTDVDPASGSKQNQKRGGEEEGAKEAYIQDEVEPIAHDGEIVLEEWQFMLIVGGCILFAVVGVAIAFYCCYRIQLASKDPDADYPSYGVTGPGTALNGDRKLAQSAQMYHYQHQKQQMIAMQKREKGEQAEDGSDYDSEEENEDGDLTVYECPGLAPTGEMQVKNPLFSEEQYAEPPNAANEDDKP